MHCKDASRYVSRKFHKSLAKQFLEIAYIFLCGSFGNIFLNLTNTVEMFSPATTIVTDDMISINPHTLRNVSVSSNTKIPKKTAVTGSKTPNIAVGVEPMYCMANVVHTNDMVVVKTDSANMLNHKYQ